MKNQQAPEIYALHTVPNEGEKPWFGIYSVRADAEHDAKVMRDATGRDWAIVRLVVADTAATPTGPITRYEVVDCIDSKHVPAVIPNGAGPWVRYEDHVSALVEAQQPAPSAACPVDNNNNFDHQTAADVLNGKTVSDEAMRKFVAVARWAHDDRVGLRATLLSVRGELASREAEIALLKKALMDAEALQPSPTPQADSQPAMTPETVYAAIAHGDEEHRAWLLSALRAVWCGEAVPPVASPIANAAADSQPALPEITAVDRLFLHYNPNTDDIVDWIQRYANAAITADRASRVQADSVTAPADGANWQDISTAPKDGTRFVAVGNNYGLYSETQHTCIAQWFRGCWMEVSDWNEASELKYLTHWVPLPPLPGSAASAPAESALKDAARWQWLADYLIGERTDLDEGIVACATIDALRQFADAARKQGANHD